MRQRLELVAGRRSAWIGIVRNEIASPHLHRVHAGCRRRHVDHPLGDRECNRMTDRAILAHLHLVLKHHLQIGAIVLEAIRCADQPEHLIAFDDAGARIGRERPDRGDVIDIHADDGAFRIERHAGAHAMIAGMNVGHERLDAVGDVFHRASEHNAERHGGHVLVIDMQLHAERTADIGSDHPDIGFRDSEMPGIDVLKLIRRLGCVMRGQPHFVRIEIGDDGARLHRHRRMAAEMEFLLDDMGGPGEQFVDIAGVDLAVEADVVAKLRRNHRGLGPACGIDIDHRWQFLIFNDHGFRRVLSQRATVGDDGHHRLSGPHRLI